MIEPPVGSKLHARLALVAAALLWSLSSFFTRLFLTPTWIGVHEPEVSPLALAFWRVLFAGLFFCLIVPRKAMKFSPLMFLMVVIFAAMNGLYISAQMIGTAANAVFLQYTAPLWMVLMTVFLLKEPIEPRGGWVVGVGTLGVTVIIAGNWLTGPVDQGAAIAMALGSGVAYAAILVCLRQLRGFDSGWLTMVNHLGAAVCLSPILGFVPLPTAPQFICLAVFGVIQMAIPYWLMARSLRLISTEEAGAITLLEPMLNPLWAYLMRPEQETPTISTAIGGVLILGALAWRYLPRKIKPAEVVHST
ncbi:DMT family transporter [Tuwongella immobilis]|uniref:EamA domain-containing protein n=1 Tax=Tuwongella immobilis TaxID=692036 RepID=A0A6C2YRZ9_9BACT|nr:DMT family transporter [Tuwongella immobilis]VIP04127.1 membrane protein : Uncharacterized protein OS=Isosphaera pallida (strain ATCC 43644 / DSM 9630 / IS1B) GN=Isop_3288 PE=4 SV=1: EamA: EamA [Tuwongella immobilis]VTS05619.1 membrane protein : Uncharacterized protein OS=Isosphaera pallida (strain ATCC 43644 / DSM 9630 / IS1B) GN=Isop_3288 PE=4 SV=1: EamA: EamA [Tuwongella immobilis]